MVFVRRLEMMVEMSVIFPIPVYSNSYDETLGASLTLQSTPGVLGFTADAR